jgi:general secretion pathway protein H
MAVMGTPPRLIRRMPGIDAKAGFTLIEMMAVMLIVALVATLAVAMVPGTERAGLKAVVMDAVALLRHERLGAIMTGRERHVSLDGGRRVLIGEDGDKVVIPADVAVDILGADAEWSGRRAVALFRADGASSGAVLKFSREKAEYEIRVNWYTGGVTVAAR